MIEFVHPCGHNDTMDERQWLENEGECPWPCQLCEGKRQDARDANSAFLAPLQAFLYAYGPVCAQMGWSSDEPYGEYDPDPWEKKWRNAMTLAMEALRENTVRAIENGLVLRARELTAEGGGERDEPDPEPLDVAGLLRSLEIAYDRTHNALWCGESGLSMSDASDAFWLFDVEGAEERLTVEMYRRIRIEKR